MSFKEAIGFLLRNFIVASQSGKMFKIEGDILMSKYIDEDTWSPATLTVPDLNSDFVKHVDSPRTFKVRLFVHKYNGEGKWVQEGAQLLNNNAWEPTDWVYDVEIFREA